MSTYPKLALERGDWINLVLALIAATGVVIAGLLL